MKTKLIIALGLLLTLSATSVEAQRLHKGHPRARIAQGVHSGSLTPGETAKLRHENRRLHRNVRRAKMNDGHIGPRERRMLKMEKRKLNRDIYRFKHN